MQNFAQYAQRLRAAIARQLRDDGVELRTLLHRLTRAHPGARVAQDMQRLDELDQRLRSALQLRISEGGSQLSRLEARLARRAPTTQLRELGLRELALRSRLNGAVQALLQRRGQQLALAQRALHGVSPLATLARGYAIVTRVADGRVLTDAAGVEAGTDIEARLGAGRLTARVIRRGS